MLMKPILLLSLSLIAIDLQTPQLKPPGQRPSDSLPPELTESETQRILRKRSPKPHVKTTLKISEAHLASARSLVEKTEYKSAAQDVDTYASLIVYADAYMRKLSPSKIKDRNICLKKLEQAIFKQSRAVDAVLRQFPINYRELAETKIQQVKRVRLRAINDLLGDGKMIKTTDDE